VTVNRSNWVTITSEGVPLRTCFVKLVAQIVQDFASSRPRSGSYINYPFILVARTLLAHQSRNFMATIASGADVARGYVRIKIIRVMSSTC
jgi:hypothetical protein